MYTYVHHHTHIYAHTQVYMDYPIIYRAYDGTHLGLAGERAEVQVLAVLHHLAHLGAKQGSEGKPTTSRVGQGTMMEQITAGTPSYMHMLHDSPCKKH